MVLTENAYKTKSNVDQTSDFKIQSSAKAFKILSSNLYKDKISAVIRELSTNAEDAHIAIKNVKPFEVTIPTYDNSIFAVKDEGVGMSEQEIYDLYTTYFSSNKTGSNDFIGALGLGSKSPFAYTDQFTIKSSKDGILNIFSCFLDERSMPVLSKIVTRESSETGTEIIVPVSKEDINEFTEKAFLILRYFKRTPIINVPAISERIKTFNDAPTILEGENFTISSHTSSGNRIDRICVRMGNVKYPVDVNQLSKGTKDLPILRILNKLGYGNSASLLIDLPIGLVDIAPSREELSYDKSTVAQLMVVISKISKEVEGGFKSKLNEFPNEKEKFNFYFSNKDMIGEFPGLDFSKDWKEQRKFASGSFYSFAKRQVRGEYRKETYLKSFGYTREVQLPIFRSYLNTLYLSISDKELRRMGMKASIVEFAQNLDSKIDTVRIVNPEDEKRGILPIFVEDGCKLYHVTDLPEIKRKQSTATRGKSGPRVQKTLANIPIRSYYNFGGKNINNCGVFYYVVSMNGNLPIFLDGYRSEDKFELFGRPTVVISRSDFKKNEKLLKKSNKAIELTKDKFLKKVRHNIKTIVKKYGPLMKNLKGLGRNAWSSTLTPSSGTELMGVIGEFLGYQTNSAVRGYMVLKEGNIISKEQMKKIKKISLFVNFEKIIELSKGLGIEDKADAKLASLILRLQPSETYSEILDEELKEVVADEWEVLTKIKTEINHDFLQTALCNEFHRINGRTGNNLTNACERIFSAIENFSN